MMIRLQEPFTRGSLTLFAALSARLPLPLPLPFQQVDGA